jgi:hypothetical protein
MFARSTRGGSVVLGMGALGSILAQGCLLAAWLAWGDLPFGRRLLQHWVAAASLCLLWLIGLITSVHERETPQVAFTVAMTVPLISLAAQLPLWIVRQLFGWRLVRLTADEPMGRDGHWTIRDLFTATVVVAVAFGIARVSPAVIAEPEFKFAWLVGGTIALIVSAATLLPTAVFLLRMQSHSRGVAYAWAYALGAVFVEWLTVGIIRWQGLTNLPPVFAFVGLSFLILAYAGTVLLAAKAARNLGYRLATNSITAKHQAGIE